MASNALTVDLIAREALEILENNLVMAKLVRRDYEVDAVKQVNGYKPGDTIRIRRPALYTVRSGAVASVQDSIEGSTTITINQQKGVDLQFGSADMTLKISDFSDRFLKDPMVKLANQVDMDLFGLFAQTWNWVGTPGQLVNSWTDFSLAPQRLDEQAVPSNDRVGIMTPADGYPLAGSFQVNTFAQPISKAAIEEAALPMMAGVKPYIAQNVRPLTVGTRAASGATQVNGANQNVTYPTGAYQQTFLVKGLTAGHTMKAGEVFSIANVLMINPVSKDVVGTTAQQFVNLADATADGSGLATLTIAPPIITSGAYQTVDSVPADSAAITWLGTASTTYRQNLVFQKGAYALSMVPMELPDAAVVKSRQTYKGLSVRLIQGYDFTNDNNLWRLDILYGLKAIDPRLAARLSGSP